MSNLSFAVITPTLQRDSLVECCKSLERQTYSNWFHIVANDLAQPDMQHYNRLAHPQRRLLCCAEHHGCAGNYCRHNAWEFTQGFDYLCWLDDDNRMERADALADIAKALEDAGRPDWAIFPIMRYGQIFFNDPPGLCMSDSANLVVKREIGQWPAMDDYCADGHKIEQLKRDYPAYKAFPNIAPIINVPVSSQGR
jgi:hypothetical protein